MKNKESAGIIFHSMIEGDWWDAKEQFSAQENKWFSFVRIIPLGESADHSKRESEKKRLTF